MGDEGRLTEVLEKVRSRHLPLPPPSPEELSRLASGGAPSDLLRFYEQMNGAGLHRDTKHGGQRLVSDAWWHWVVLPISEMETVQERGYLQPDSPFYNRSAHWRCLVDVQDGDYLAISLEPGHVGEIIDCFHETVGKPGESSIIALSFTELMEQLVESKEAFWLQKGHREYGVY